ncbi:MAG: hypothetical protein PHS62_05140, partial [Patescibacteria group bacterium]|nr:hypothetical protein [Patescibacteria group bacterium]
MSIKWLNLFLHFSGRIFFLKQKIVEAKSWIRALPYVFLLLLTEILFLIVSLPLYLIVSPKKLQESGFIFPSQEKEPVHFHVYIVRRKISLATVFGAGGIFLLKFVFVGLVSTYLLGAQALLAATQDWNLNVPGDYTYDSAKIEVTGGVAQLKDQGTGGSCGGAATACNTFVTSPTCAAQAGCSWGGGASGATTNPDFTGGSTGWTGADWTWTPTTETRITTGGNPTAYIQISAPKAKSIVGGGYWYQSFTTTAANPTATVNFDWKNTAYQAGATVTAYVFVDTGSGVPVVGSQVWSQAITGTTAWASVANIDVSTKVTTAGTYFLKVAYYINNGTGNTGPYTIGFDNVALNWSKAGTCSGTPTACNTYVASPACSAQAGGSWTTVPVYASTSPSVYHTSSLAPANVTSWNSFIETATGVVNYQLSSDDGTTWKYWNNSAWATATTTANANSASVVNSNINLFSAAAGKIRWKAFLVSNGSQQVILDNVAIGYIQNNPPAVSGLSASQNTTSGYVKVDYTLTDEQSDPASLVAYEYSLTGAFAGEQSTMTAAPADPSHSGVSGLSTSPAGVAHTFVWNASSDLGNIFSHTVYVRLRANDGIADSDFLASSAFSADYVSPVVSGVTAAQAPASADIQIAYDLADDTASDILVELQISANGGSTWAVPATSVSGDVGPPVTSGNGKSIVWQAGTDYANQEQSNMMVRIRAKDKYQNQGGYMDSAAFALDNKAPVIAAPADLLAQPLSGATEVLVGGSFSEGNPDTNNFYVAINGGSFGAAVPGDANTATPSDKNVPVGSTLDGNDYISAIKIQETDDFGQMTVNETTSPNSAYKYVKPYTPPAPTVNNPGEDTIDVIINQHPAEANGLEYAIFEDSQSKYLQGDGSFSSAASWQTIGTIKALGLSQPISQYSFKVKSRNPSDASHAATSESDFGSSASSDYRSPNLTITSVEQATDGTKLAVVDYVGVDYQNQANDLVKYEYSLDGSSWQTMTEKTGGLSDGVTALPFSGSGENLTFVWDVGADLPDLEDSAVYIRLEANDSISNSNLAVSSAFTVDTAGPVVANIRAAQTLGADEAVIIYDLADSAGADNVVALSISDDSGATYNVAAPSVSGDVGAGVMAGLTRNIVWNAGADLPSQEKNAMKIKIAATDSYGNAGSPVESGDFSVDTKVPVVSNVSAAQISGSALVAVNYDLADMSPAAVEFDVSSDSGASWNVATTTYTGEVGVGQTAGAKTFSWNAAADFPDQESAAMRVRVRATDNFGHQSALQESADFSVNTKILSISDITAEQNTGAGTVAIHYNLNKAATINLDISADGGATWAVATTTLTGAIGSVALGNNKTVSWNAGLDYNNEEKSAMRVRLSGLDAAGTLSPYYESVDFSLDTASPLGLLSLSKFGQTATSVTLNWPAGVADAHFSHYELWHGADQNDVINRAGAALKWSVADDANLDVITAIATVITGLNLTGDYFVKIWAIDDYGNEATAAELNVYSAPVLVNYILEMQAPDGSGSTDPGAGNHSYLQGTTLQIAAAASSSWAFDHWVVDGVLGNGLNPLSLLMSANHTLKAVFVESTAPVVIPPAAEPAAVASVSGGGAVIVIQPDITAPSKPVLSPLITPTRSASVNISGLAEAGSTIDLYDNGILIRRLDKSANADGQFSQTVDFTAGEHILTVKAVDASNNASQFSDPVDLSIITAAPKAPIVLSPESGGTITQAAPVLIGVADPQSLIEIILDGKNKFTAVADMDGAWQFKLASDYALKVGE